MISCRFQRIATWLCLVLTLFTGVVPAQGIVLCLEADGCVSIEIRAPLQGCGGCEEHLDETASRADDPLEERDGVCPCIDLALPGASEAPRMHSAKYELLAALALAPLSIPSFARTFPCTRRTECAPPRPRPPDTLLRMIQSVVILR